MPSHTGHVIAQLMPLKTSLGMGAHSRAPVNLMGSSWSVVDPAEI